MAWKILDLSLLVVGAALVAVGSLQLSVPVFLMTLGAALIVLGCYGGKK